MWSRMRRSASSAIRGTVTAKKLNVYQSAGINRLSIGLQSTNNEELKALGRIHTYDQFLKTYELARNAGFENINIDLMSGLPYQTLDKFFGIPADGDPPETGTYFGIFPDHRKGDTVL